MKSPKIQTAVICMLFVFGFPFSACAERAPIPKKKAQALSNIKKKLESETKQKSVLQKEIGNVDRDLKKTKKTLVVLAEQVHHAEESLRSLEQRISNLTDKQKTLTEQLEADKGSMAKLILALTRIRRSPPEAMLARSETPYKTAQSAMLMADILPSINKHAQTLKSNLSTLSIVSNELVHEQEDLIEQTDSFKIRQGELTKLLNKRNKLYTKINSDLKTRELSIASISLQAKDLEELVEKIKTQQRKEDQKRKKKNTEVEAKHKKVISSIGKARLPITGAILTAFNETDNLGAKSKGITFIGRPNGLVIAPMNGQIQFTGAFKRYGNIVIIEHAGGHHSLLAGLDKISSQVGDQIKSGEPIGTLPNSALIPRPKLYYELRLNGKPINPSAKFAKLG